MKILFPLAAVIIFVLIAFVGVRAANLQFFFGIIIPYAALAAFILGFIYRIVRWGRSPVPFCIPATCGQQESLPWIKQNRFENPSNIPGVLLRMALEVFLFRSLFRNLKTEARDGRLAYGSDKWLWLAGMAFHWSFLVILLRHIRFFSQPAPFFLHMIEGLDGFLQIGLPGLLLSGMMLAAAAIYLFFRRVFISQVRYISLPADYFPLFLIMGIASSGLMMRYFFRVDVVSVKELMMGLVTFKPHVPDGIGSIFYVHLFLISTLFAYFPFSKLMHMGGIFMSPTRNMANNSRRVRHVNPWNYPVKVHTYEEYENDFREKMKMADIPVEKE